MLQRTRELGAKLMEVKEFARIPGRGVRGKIETSDVLVGGEGILSFANSTPPQDLLGFAKEEGNKGRTVNYVIRDGEILGVLAFADLIRDESYTAIRELKARGVRVAMITGDSEEVAAWVAKELGIEEHFARVLPEEKVEKVKLLQTRGLRVAMVGDGINDAPALTQADVGVAIGAGTNVAIESAGIVLVKNDPRDIPKIIELSRLTYSKMLQNLFWATGYNVIAIPLAGGILASRGILLEPALAALFMSLSTVIVALNALLLRRRRL
ncbi:HAD family hydrolase [Candidatus Parcubacteria bacterium]|nr:MAG: HAD family hydrolase [Candidatus Parcubacteria bacterium]